MTLYELIRSGGARRVAIPIETFYCNFAVSGTFWKYLVHDGFLEQYGLNNRHARITISWQVFAGAAQQPLSTD